MKRGHEHYDIRYTKHGMEKGENSKRNIHHFLDTLRTHGMQLDIEPASESSHVWGLPYETFGFPDADGKRAMTPVTIRTEDWVELQRILHGANDAEVGATKSTVESIPQTMEEGHGNKIPAPVLDIDEEGNIDYDEGRSRGVGALKAGMERIPIWITAKEYH